jgi:excisionase family DNA binding protein
METIAPTKRMLDMHEAADYIGASHSTLQDNHKKWCIPSYKVGRNIVFRECELEQWLQDHRQV